MRNSLLLALLASSAVPVEAQEGMVVPSVWFSPNYKSRDYFRLFEAPDEWEQARSKISVFKAYSYQMFPGCPGSCLDGARGDEVIGKLKAWGIDLAFETGAIKEHTCTGAVAAAVVIDAIRRVEAKGGVVSWISMDEPLQGGQHTIGGKSCGMTPDEIAKETAIYIDAIRKASPGIRIGDIEPFPAQSIKQQQAFLELLLDKYKAKLDFFHWDVDPNALKGGPRSLEASLGTMRAYVEKRGIPFGLIFWGNSADTDCDYYVKTMRWTGAAAAAMTPREPAGAPPRLPQHVLFQSWTHSVPVNLPESDTSVYSHARIVNEGMTLLTGSTTLDKLKLPKCK